MVGHVHKSQLLDIAKQLLTASKSRPEDNIRQDISRLLHALDIENLITYRTPAGPADIYLPRRRIFIEAKAVGLADDPKARQSRDNPESPFQQVQRYLLSELKSEKEQIPHEQTPDLQWTAIVTDGRVWHVWLYDHDTGAVAREQLMNFRPRDPGELLNRLVPVFMTDPVGKPWIPSDPRPLFEPALKELEAVHASLTGKRFAETQTKADLWLEMLRTANMEPESIAARIKLFVTHSFLVVLARGVIHTLASPNKKPDPVAILGDGFVSWVISTSRGTDWAQTLLDDIHRHEWRRRGGDVLRPLYESVVGERDRKAFGEYYTPDWLAELLVEQVLDDAWCQSAVEASIGAELHQEPLRGIGVLDPACGSGTFLYHAARRLLASPELSDFEAPRRAGIVSRLVAGMDVHPVAAEISRATLLRALPAEPPDGKSSLRIYEGDSLLVNVDDETSLFKPRNGEIRISTPQGAEVFMPRSFVELPEFPESLRRFMISAADRRDMPTDIGATLPAEDRDALGRCHREFTSIIENEGNSVWTWYIVNISGPVRLSEQKVDRIVANPPWLAMAHIQAEGRKRALEKFAAEDLELWTGGKNAPHFDIAQLFVRRARELYLEDPDSNPAAWLVKRSARTSASWANFRKWHKPILAQFLDLEEIKPFGGGDARRACVLFEFRASDLVPRKPAEITAACKERRPAADASLQAARRQLQFRRAPKPLPEAPSEFVDRWGDPLFRQGATITPKVLAVAANVAASGRDGKRKVTTARSEKSQWKDILPRTGEVPKGWVRELLTSNELLPFAARPDLPHAIIPVDGRGRLLEDPGAKSTFWRELDELYQEHRGQGRSTPKTLVRQIDYSAKLASQLEMSGARKSLVLHPTSGDIMRGARTVPGSAILQHTIHYLVATSADEAAFLVALLNAPSLNRAFVQSRTSGRHFTNGPWRTVPVPRFDRSVDLHRRLASLCKRAEKVTDEWVQENSREFRQVAASKRIRERLDDTGIIGEIDEAARQLLPDQAR